MCVYIVSANGAVFENGQTDMIAGSLGEISITLIILEVLCMVAVPCSASCDRTQIVCRVLVALLQLSMVQCLCDVSYCIDVYWETRQGSLSQIDVRTFIKFHVLLGKVLWNVTSCLRKV
jgi:hypothetical protein